MRPFFTIMILGLSIAVLASGCASGAEEATAQPVETEAPQPAETLAEESPAPEETLPPEEAVTEEPSSGDDWAPTGDAVWTLSRDPVVTSSTEACPEPIHFDFYGLVAIAPADGDLTWQRQTSLDVLPRVEPNHYAGPAQSVLPGYTLTIDVTFTSPTTLTVIHTLIPDDNPDCHHVFEYTGDFSW